MQSPPDIASIERIYLNANGDIVVEAILEDAGPLSSPQTLYDPPEYAPGLCRTIIYKECVPSSVKLEDNQELLEKIIDNNNLLVFQDWEPIVVDDSDRFVDYYDEPVSNLYF
jgi:hypothetical protein